MLIDVNRAKAEGEAMDLSLPTIVDQVGVERVLHLDLSPHELKCLRRLADILKTMVAQLNWEAE